MDNIEELIQDYLNQRCSLVVDPTTLQRSLYSIEKLTGGLVNFVYRVKITHERAQSENYISSFIVKHYKSHLSSSPLIPISLERYELEKEALTVVPKALEEQSFYPLVPHLLNCEDESHLLILQDMGSGILSLFDCFKYFQLHPDDFTPDLIQNIIKSLVILEASLLKITNNNDPSGISKFFSSGTNEMIQNYVYKEFEARVESLPPLQKYIPLIQRCLKRQKNYASALINSNFTALPQDFQIVFGDLWPNALFFRKNETTFTNEVIVLDWEFAGIRHCYNDYFHLLPYLLLMAFDHQYYQPAVALLKESLLQLIFKEPQRAFVEDNLGVFLCNIALVINDDRWNFYHDQIKVCESITQELEEWLSRV